MSGWGSMFSALAGQAGKAPKDGAPASGGGFMSNYGGAIVSGLSSLFSARSEQRAQQDRANMTRAEAELQRSFDVDDINYARKTELENKSYRQGLLNPYARYKKGA